MPSLDKFISVPQIIVLKKCIKKPTVKKKKKMLFMATSVLNISKPYPPEMIKFPATRA